MTIVEVKHELCRDSLYLHHEAVLLKLQELGAVTRTGVRCTYILPDGILVQSDSREEKLDADAVIIAAEV